MKRFGNFRVTKDYNLNCYVIQGKMENGAWINLKDEKEKLEFETEDDGVKWLMKFFQEIQAKNSVASVSKKTNESTKVTSIEEFKEKQQNRQKNIRRRKNKQAKSARKANRRK